MSLLSFVPYRNPMITTDGLVTPIWSQWFAAMALRVGGPESLTNTELDALTQLGTLDAQAAASAALTSSLAATALAGVFPDLPPSALGSALDATALAGVFPALPPATTQTDRLGLLVPDPAAALHAVSVRLEALLLEQQLTESLLARLRSDFTDLYALSLGQVFDLQPALGQFGTPALAAPPKVTNASALGTIRARYAWEDHTHQGVNLDDPQTITGLKTFNTGAGNPPFVVTGGTAQVANLNADLLDGLDSTALVQIAGAQTITGRKTFQTDLVTPLVIGSVASGGNLTLRSSEHATKGKILFGTSGYDEVNNRLGLGAAIPGYTLEVFGPASVSHTLHIQNNMAAFNTTDSHAVLYGTGNAGGAYPFLTAGNLVLQSRPSGANRDIVFVTGATPAARMVIDGTGNVGINEPLPRGNFFSGYKTLHMSNPDAVNGTAIRLERTGAGINTIIGGIEATNSNTTVAVVDMITEGGASDAGAIRLATHPTGGTLTERLRVSSVGNLGLGVTPGAGRARAFFGGTAVATTDMTLSGWGASATVTAVTGTDTRGTVTVTTNAADTPSANPYVLLTFKDGTWTTTPFGVACMYAGASTGPLAAVATSMAATQLYMTYCGTPTALVSRTYGFTWQVLG